MLLRTPGASFFHSSAWARVLSESYGYTPFYFTVIENGNLRGLVPMMEVDSFLTGRRGVSLPFTDYCDPLLDGDISFQELFSQTIDYGKKRNWKYIELRGGSDLEPRTSNLEPVSSSSSVQPSAFSLQPSEVPSSSNLAPCPLCLVPFCSYLGHTLDLSGGEEKIFSSLRDSTRRNIKKARNQGVEVKISRDSVGVSEFYRLNCMTRKEHGLPPQPFHFFGKIYQYIISRGLGFVGLASHDGRNIAGAVFLHFGDKGLYKYGASDMKFQDLRGNNLVMWEGLRWFCNNGYKNFCFGRTELENEGLRQFKNGWGSEEHQIRYFKYSLAKEAFIPDKTKGAPIYTSFFRQLPMPALNVIGSWLYRHMG